MTERCFICTKHRDLRRMPGGQLLADEHAIVSRLPLATPTHTAESVYLGYLFVEPRRHVGGLGELTPDEAGAMGRLAASASAALHAVGAEHVYAALIGHGIDHLHLHLIARWPGTPREFWWVRVDEWPEAPRGRASDVAALMDRLRQALD
jgi:histidine triad (HIT) family protein